MSVLPFRLRRCTEADAARVSLVAAAAFLETFAGILDGDDVLDHCQRNNSPEAFTKYLSQDTAACVIAEAEPGAAPIGYALICAPDLPVALEEGDCELRRIYLLHRFQRMGVGRALMESALQIAQEQGGKRLLLGVYGKNYSAIRFYQRVGFTQIGERYFTVGKTTHHDAVMAQLL